MDNAPVPQIPDHELPRQGVSLQTLVALALAFALGFVAQLALSNIINNQQYSFSTPDLINFVLSVLLSGASISLAVAAISLGKLSEDAIIRRNDESIKIQYDVFRKTTEALQQIQSSTAVTEKRIEDIIAGRAPDLSRAIVELAAKSNEIEGRPASKEIEDLIRSNLLQAFRDSYGGPKEGALRLAASTRNARGHGSNTKSFTRS